MLSFVDERKDDKKSDKGIQYFGLLLNFICICSHEQTFYFTAILVIVGWGLKIRF